MLPPVMNRLGAERRWLRFGLAAAILVFAGLLALSSPGDGPGRPFFPCGFHAISGLPCLFCGGTRAVRAILHGNLRSALYLNAIAFPALALVALTFVVLLAEAASGRSLAPGEAFFRHLNRFAPVLILPALAWWMLHIYFALMTPKPELVDFQKPVAAKARAMLKPPDARQ